MSDKALEGWTETTLWFKRGIDDPEPLEFVLMLPPGCSDKNKAKLSEKTASQMVGMIKKLSGCGLVIQGQHRLVPKDDVS